MTDDDSIPTPDEPTQPLPPIPAFPEPAPTVPSSDGGRPGAGPGMGHIVLGAILVLIGVGWLLEALDLVDVPWRFLLPSALIIIGAALVFGARSGRHGGLIAIGVALTILVLLAGALEVLVDVPLAAGIGDETLSPTAVIKDEYRWGLGKMTLDLRGAQALRGETIEASVVVGELIVLVPSDVSLQVTARSGVGEVVVLGESNGGFDVDLACTAEGQQVDCGDGAVGDREGQTLRLDLEVAVGKVEVQR
jgi:hypothetical protein